LELEPDAGLLLFVGSMIDLKNPLFLVEMLPHMLDVDRNIAAVFVGTGPDQIRVAQRARDLGVADRVRVLGWREDVHRLMRASDLFVNPRREHPIEGFGIVNVEAQAVGLRMIVSDGISSEPLVDGTIYSRVPLVKGAEEWARVGLELLKRPRLSPDETRSLFQRSRFDPDIAVRDLHEIYRGLSHKSAMS
jgi:glycosyltransferase EpsF